MIKNLYVLVLLMGLSSFLQGQTNKKVIAIKADYYPDYEYNHENDGVATTGRVISIEAKTELNGGKGGWIGLPQGKTYPDNSLILTEVTTEKDGTTLIATPMEKEGEHRFKAMPANIKTSTNTLGAYLKGFIDGYGKEFKPEDQDKYAWYITSGKRGLDLSTGVTNIPSKDTIYYGAVIVDLNRVGDGKPDLIITQIADPARSADTFQLLDKEGKVILKNDKKSRLEVKVNFSNVSSLGSRDWNFYYSNNSRFDSPKSRDLRMVTFDLKDFGVDENNYKKVAQLRYIPSGDSDTAFLAADEYSMIIYRNACDGTSDGENPGGAKVGISTLQRGKEDWLSNDSGAYLELESSKKGFVITNNDDPAKNIDNPEEGMIVWDTTEKCLKIYNDISGKPQWHCIEKCIKKP